MTYQAAVFRCQLCMTVTAPVLGELERDPSAFVRDSYRYMRIGLAVLAAMLGFSLLFAWLDRRCLLGSISAYYYTPVHAVFVGALVAIGITLVALKGRDPVEDLLFNLAGMLAPIVALVPTSRPTSDACAETVRLISLDGPSGVPDVPSMVNNNIGAGFAAGGLALIIAAVMVVRANKTTEAKPGRPVAVGLLIAAVVLGGGAVWFFGWRGSFDRRAHGGTAITMFVFIWLAVVVNGGWPKPVLDWVYRKLRVEPPGPPPEHWEKFPPRYRLVAAGMVVGGILAVVLGGRTRVFWLEVVEIAGFAFFWLGQTDQYWYSGAAPLKPDQPADAATTTLS